MVRQVAGDTATATGQVRVRRSVATAPQRPYPWAARVVNDLKAAQPRVVAGIGTVRAVEIWFPPQHRGGTQQGRAPALPDAAGEWGLVPFEPAVPMFWVLRRFGCR